MISGNKINRRTLDGCRICRSGQCGAILIEKVREIHESKLKVIG